MKELTINKSLPRDISAAARKTGKWLQWAKWPPSTLWPVNNANKPTRKDLYKIIRLHKTQLYESYLIATERKSAEVKELMTQHSRLYNSHFFSCSVLALHQLKAWKQQHKETSSSNVWRMDLFHWRLYNIAQASTEFSYLKCSSSCE